MSEKARGAVILLLWIAFAGIGVAASIRFVVNHIFQSGGRCEMNSRETPAISHSRERFASELRRINPKRLAAWDGVVVVDGLRANPYVDYGVSLHLGEERGKQIAELLVGDALADALLHRSLVVRPIA
ncbi:hypothetical protein [Bradyrhizobium japonicum]|uniref:hypothetical protein n=1 Tax=Bradyrhizobium japonicum TaxID=375 RepID=UPI001BABFB2C|nr:hypothetical protein [Bradyrhizobium japonicum]MBR0962201.1 hypothetical protein [Bradyrhizobium japonicum]